MLHVNGRGLGACHLSPFDSTRARCKRDLARARQMFISRDTSKILYADLTRGLHCEVSTALTLTDKATLLCKVSLMLPCGSPETHGLAIRSTTKCCITCITMCIGVLSLLLLLLLQDSGAGLVTMIVTMTKNQCISFTCPPLALNHRHPLGRGESEQTNSHRIRRALGPASRQRPSFCLSFNLTFSL
jgi:hypothetical protein